MNESLLVRTDELLATLPPAVRADLRALETVAAALAAQVVRLTVRVAELEARLSRTSANSSKPPVVRRPARPAGPAQEAVWQGQGRARPGQQLQPRAFAAPRTAPSVTPPH